MATRGDTLDQSWTWRYDGNEASTDAVNTVNGRRFMKLQIPATSSCNQAFGNCLYQVTIPHNSRSFSKRSQPSCLVFMMPDLFLSQIQALVLYLAVNELSISSKFSILRLTSPVPIDIA